MNVFISYDFDQDLACMQQVSAWLKKCGCRNYALSIEERSNTAIWDEIYKRSWVCSVIIVLVGKGTAQSRWIQREIRECLKVDNSLNNTARRRVRKPKGILAIQLPGGPHPLPKLVKKRVQENTAVCVDWKYLKDHSALLEQLLLAKNLRPA